MKVEGSYTFDAPRDEVWEAMLDPDVLAKALPGCEKMEQTGENEYAAVMNVMVGPVQGRFNGNVRLSDLNPPESYSMSVDGQGGPGFVKGEGHVTLEAQNGTTAMRYTGDAQVGGRIASVGQRLLDSSVKSLTRQGLDSINSHIQARQAPAEDGAPTPQPAPAPPTQTRVAATVAKDVARDMVPLERRPIVVLAVLILVAMVFSRLRARGN
jgi:carbon monoxide dehydrogenase subunit G